MSKNVKVKAPKAVKPLSEHAEMILDTLGLIESGTMAEIAENGAPGIVSGHFTALRNRGYVEGVKMDITCGHCNTTKKATVYTITEAGLGYLDAKNNETADEAAAAGEVA